MKTFFTQTAVCLALAAGTLAGAQAQSPANSSSNNAIQQAQNIRTAVRSAPASNARQPRVGNKPATVPAARAAQIARIWEKRRKIQHLQNADAPLAAGVAPGAGTAAISGNWPWAKGFGSSTANHFEGSQTNCTDAAGNVYSAMIFQGTISANSVSYTSAGSNDMLVLSYDAAGQFRWAKHFGGTGIDEPSGLCITPDGNMYLLGFASAAINFGSGVSYTMPSGVITTGFLLKVNSSNGTPISVKNLFASSGDDYVGVIALGITSAGHPVIAGFVSGDMDVPGGTSSDFDLDPFVLSLPGTGTSAAPRWFYRAEAQDIDSSASFYSVAVDASDRIYCAGTFMGDLRLEAGNTITSNGRDDGFMMQVSDALGDWQRAVWVGTSGNDGFNQVAMDHGKPLTVGYYAGPMSVGSLAIPFRGGTGDMMAIRFSPTLDSADVSSGGGPSSESAYCVTVDPAGTAHIGGFFAGTASFGLGTSNTATSVGGVDAFVWSLDYEANVSRNFATVGGPKNDAIYDITPGINASVMVTGLFTNHIDLTGTLSLDSRRPSTTADQADAFIARLDPSCVFSPTFSIQLNGKPCQGNRITLGATGVPAGATYSWTGPNGFRSTLATPQIDLTANSSGQYSLVLSDASNCSSPAQTYALTVQTVAAPNVGNATRCGPGSVTITPLGAPTGGKYRWYTQRTGGTPIDSNLAGTSYTTPGLSANTAYYVSTVSAAGCEGGRSLSLVNLADPFTASIEPGSSDTTLCQGSLIRLTAKPDGETYFWSDGSTSQTVTVTANKTLSVTVGRIPGCTATTAPVTVRFTPRPNSSFSYGATQFCIGSTNATPVMNTQGGSFRSSSPNLVVDPATGIINLAASQPGNYFVMYRVGTACKDSTRRDVVILPRPQASFTYDSPAYCQGPNTAQAMLNTGSQAGLFQAIPAPGLSLNSTTGAITLATSQPGTYRVYNLVAAQPGCQAAKDSFFVVVNPTPVVTVVPTPAATACEGERIVLRATTSIPSSIVWTPAGSGDSVVATTNGIYQALATAGSCQGTSPQLTVSFTPRPALPTLTQTPVGGGMILTASSATTGVTYRWYLNGIVVPNHTAPQLPLFDPSQSGAYSVEAVLQGCSSPVTTPVLIVITSLRSGKLHGLKVYPNPAQGRLTVQLPAGVRSGTARILSAEGKQVRLASVLSSGANRLDVSALPKGLYLLQVVTDEGTSQQPVVVE